MMKKIAFLLLPLLSSTASAVMVDLRHEYLDDSKANYDRVYISHRFDNGFGFAVEAKTRSGGDDQERPFSEFGDNGDEYTLSYQFSTSDFVIQPGFVLETASSTAIYKPYLRVQYNINDQWWVAVRYRYEYSRNTDSGSEVDKDDGHMNRGDVWLGYNVGNLGFELNALYKKSDQVIYNNDKDDYEYNFRTSYKIDNITPYVEVGNVSVSSSSEDRQTRFRVGMAYTF